MTEQDELRRLWASDCRALLMERLSARQEIERDGARSRCLQTVRGYGCKLVPAGDPAVA